MSKHTTSTKYVRSNFINHSLNSSGSMDVDGDVHKSWENLHHQSLKNLRVCCFDYLLAEIVTKLICHNIGEDRHHAMHQTGVEYSIDLHCAGFIDWV